MYPALLPLMRKPRLPVVGRTDSPADLNGLVLFAERRNLVSARVLSHFKRSLPQAAMGLTRYYTVRSRRPTVADAPTSGYRAQVQDAPLSM